MIKLGADNWLKDEEELKRNREERAEFGFGVSDWWNFDRYISQVVATAVLKFSTDGNGYFAAVESDKVMDPDNGYSMPEGTEERFHEFCKTIHDDLMNWVLCDDDWSDEGREKYEKAKAAMIRFAENLGHWWD